MSPSPVPKFKLPALHQFSSSMSSYVRVPPKDIGMRLDRWLRTRLPSLPQSIICRLIRKQAITVSRKQTTFGAAAPTTEWTVMPTEISTRLETGAFVMLPANLANEAFAHSERSTQLDAPTAVDFALPHTERQPLNHTKSNMSHKQQRQMHATLSETEQSRLRSWVLYADQHVIAINKPPKLPVQGGPGVHRALTDWLHYLRELPNITTEHVQLVDSLNVPSASQPSTAASPTPYSTRAFSTQAKFKAFQPGTIPQGPKRSASARLLDSLTAEEKLLFTDKVIKRKKEPRAVPLVDISAPTEPKPTVTIEIPPARKLQRFATNQTPSPVAQSAKPSNSESRPTQTQTSHIDLDNDDSALETPRLVHRLDAETSGVLLLARSRQAAHKFTDMFRTHDYEKTYWAVCEGRPQPAAGIIDQPLSILSDDKPASAESHEHVTQTAITKYSTVASNQECSWLELKPKTGRKHQLRRHVLLLDCCIVGDKKHAADESLSSDALSRRQRVKSTLDVSEPTLHLHARAIRFKHPFSNQIMEISANLPTHMLRSMHKLKFDVGKPDEKTDVERASKTAL